MRAANQAIGSMASTLTVLGGLWAGVGCGDDTGSGADGAGATGAQATGGSDVGGAAGGGAGGETAGGGGGIAGGGGTAGGGGGSGGSGSECTEAGDECAPGLFCSRSGCGNAGICEAMPPPNSDLVLAPVCGCDGVTYWNAAIAKLAAASIRAEGECGASDAVGCDSSTPCTTGTQKCNREVGAAAMCGADAVGTCWGMPIACAVGPQARACSNDACAATCLLIQSQNAWYDAGDCP